MNVRRVDKEKNEVNKREVHDYDVGTHDPDAMVVPPTPESTCKAATLARAPPTIECLVVYYESLKRELKKRKPVVPLGCQWGF